MADWEIFVFNNQILKDALFNKDFYIPDKKYYLTNVGYYNMDYFFPPYQNICYHFKKQALSKKKLVNKEELFNFYHINL